MTAAVFSNFEKKFFGNCGEGLETLIECILDANAHLTATSKMRVHNDEVMT
jgi:hypothetical protein